jgi:2-succinyl-6-hydroxy-2,4-cyclohexadiene-1-carboxylate synthase
MTVALLHGFTGRGESFAAVTDELAGEGIAVDAPALLGHGADDAAVDSFESEVDRLARHLGDRAGSYDLVGYSLGARLGLGLLVRHPGLFRSATLISVQPGLREEAARAGRRDADERWCALLESEGLAAFVAAWERLPLFETQSTVSERALVRQRTERLSHDPLGLARSLRTCGLGVMPPYWDRLAAISVPTTLIVGDRDAKFVAIAREMSALMPRARLVVIPGAGHNVVLERPDAIVQAVLPYAREAA